MTTSAAVPMSGTKLLAQADESRLRDVMPLIIRRWSNGAAAVDREGRDLHVLVPPTSCTPPAFMAPGTSTASMYWLRAAGSASMTSAGMTLLRLVLCTSTVGDSPVTVTVSSTEPTVRSALTVAANEPASSMPSRLTTLKPVSVKVSE